MDSNDLLAHDMRNSAFVISQSVCAMIEALGMTAHNQSIGRRDQMFSKDDFDMLINKYGIHHNAVLTTMDPNS